MDLLFTLVLLWVIANAGTGVRAIADGWATVKAANAGKWDVIEKNRQRQMNAAERRAERRTRWAQAWAGRRRARHEAVGGAGDPGPGFRRYWRLVYRGWWEDRERAYVAKREARGPVGYDPDRVTLRDRVRTWWRQKAGPVVSAQVRKLRGGVPATRPAPPPKVPHDPNLVIDIDVDDEALRAQRERDDETTVTDPWRYSTPVKSRGEDSTMTQPVPTGETTGVVSGVNQAANLRLANASLRDSTTATIDQMLAAVEAQEAAAADLDMDPATAARIAQAREALASLKATVNAVGEEVDGAIGGVQGSWEKHLPGVELNAATGGVAKREAYSGD